MWPQNREVLNLRVSDLSGRKIVIQEPKSGRDAEVAFMPEHIAARLAEYVAGKQLSADDRVVSLSAIRQLGIWSQGSERS